MEGCGYFTLFSRLPSELRDEIWTAAIHNENADRQAHSFTLHAEETVEISHLEFDKADGAMTWWDEKARLCPPLAIYTEHPIAYGGGESQSQTRGQVWGDPTNKSGYLMGSGLWGACTESRKAIIRNWRSWLTPRSVPYKESTELGGLSDPFGIPYRVNIVKMPPSTEYSCELWTVTRPKLDLLVVDTPDLATMDGSQLDHASWRYTSSDTYENFAFKYDPKWAAQVRYGLSTAGHDSGTHFSSWGKLEYSQTEVGGLARQLQGVGDRNQDLWLIDASLKPVDGVSYGELLSGGRTRFRARGCRYIEVREVDMNQMWTSDLAPVTETFTCGDGEVYDSPHVPHAHVFFDSFLQLLRDRYDINDCMNPPDIAFEELCQCWHGLEPNVLACLADGVLECSLEILEAKTLGS